MKTSCAFWRVTERNVAMTVAPSRVTWTTLLAIPKIDRTTCNREDIAVSKIASASQQQKLYCKEYKNDSRKHCIKTQRVFTKRQPVWRSRSISTLMRQNASALHRGKNCEVVKTSNLRLQPLWRECIHELVTDSTAEEMMEHELGVIKSR